MAIEGFKWYFRGEGGSSKRRGGGEVESATEMGVKVLYARTTIDWRLQ